MKVDIIEYINTKNEQITFGILEKFKTNEGQSKLFPCKMTVLLCNLVDIHAINAFVIGIPWILYSKQNKTGKLSKQESELLMIVLENK